MSNPVSPPPFDSMADDELLDELAMEATARFGTEGGSQRRLLEPTPTCPTPPLSKGLCEPTDRDVFLRWATEAEIAAAPELAGLHRR